LAWHEARDGDDVPREERRSAPRDPILDVREAPDEVVGIWRNRGLFWGPSKAAKGRDVPLTLMRAYKFLNEEYGLKSLRERRLRQSRIHELNDPFELTPYDLTEPELREAFLKTRDDIADDKGMVCFSADWRDPVIWAHYSDKHYGICLGFELPEITGDVENDESGLVSYIRNPLSFPSNFEERPDLKRFEIVRKVLFTKFKHWAYEKEIRIWAPLQNEADGHYFLEFDEKLRLVEVVIGARCKLTQSEITHALGSLAGEVKIIKARAAYNRFEMVEDVKEP
jgi:hypothetical protein